jgi:hypothetical protein
MLASENLVVEDVNKSIGCGRLVEDVMFGFTSCEDCRHERGADSCSEFRDHFGTAMFTRERLVRDTYIPEL